MHSFAAVASGGAAPEAAAAPAIMNGRQAALPQVGAGAAHLGGRLELHVLPEARLSYGVTLEFLTAASVTGESDELILPVLPNGEPMFRVRYGADRVALVCVPEPAGGALVAVGLILLLGYIGLGRSRP